MIEKFDDWCKELRRTILSINKMTQEDKELLINDLCARLPYGVKCNIDLGENSVVRKLSKIDYDGINTLFGFEGDIPIRVYVSEIKPFLFPMSSMTEEQEDIVYDKFGIDPDIDICICFNDETIEYINWLNQHHFDYRGLIDKGLAIDVTSINIY